MNVEENEEKHFKDHTLETLGEFIKETAKCPLEKEWKCNNCKDFPKHFMFVTEVIVCLCSLLSNLIMSNPDLELFDMREDPSELLKEIIKKIPDIYQ